MHKKRINKKKMNKRDIEKMANIFGTITMLDFLCDYIGLNTQFDSLRKATHKDIKFLGFDGVKTVPFGIINSDDLASGRYILVTDYYHNIGAYENPLFVNSIENINIDKNKCKNIILLKSKR